MAFKKHKSSTPQAMLACTVCMQRNYTTTRSGTLQAEQKRLSLKKFCSNCQAHTLHQETK
ncbi:MAG: 50S ribosomal protein L33 [Vampirovibrionales bacterium]|nr:50S ribosomal protein L33 [Vampirovibrionales bacterium]